MQIPKDENGPDHRHDRRQASRQVQEIFRRPPPPAWDRSNGTTGPARRRTAAVEGDMRPVTIPPILGGSGSSHSPREGVGIPKYCRSLARP